MTDRKATEANAIVARCRRIGWGVEVGTGRQTWDFRISLPNRQRVEIHNTPSDVNWKSNVMRRLNAAGFAEAEAEWRKNNERARKATIAADRKRNDETAKRTAKRAAERDQAVRRAAGELGVQPADMGWLLTPAELPQQRTVLIGPADARKILDEANTQNRPLRESQIVFLMEVIADGHFGLTHQGIAIDNTGVLQDGQHRLHAIARGDTAVPLLVMVGADPANFRRIDTGAPRTARDVAALRGEVNTNVLTAAARMLLLIEAFGGDVHHQHSRARFSNEKIDAAVVAYGDPLRDAVARAKKIKREINTMNAAALATAIYRINERVPGDPRVDEFFTKLETGEDIKRTDPVAILRRIYIRRNTNAPRIRRLPWETAAHIFKAWNFTASGVSRQIMWNTDHVFPADPYLPPALGGE